MSLVGPRPALVDEVAKFDEESLRRLTVLPGITGLWQIEARDNPSFHAYRRFDLLYVDNWSIGLDISILIATGPVVVEHALRALAHSLIRNDRVRPAMRHDTTARSLPAYAWALVVRRWR
jgi:lipopolysaccharide/colanic/teichoic acid biosynthesis glycosyltransferase